MFYPDWVSIITVLKEFIYSAELLALIFINLIQLFRFVKIRKLYKEKYLKINNIKIDHELQDDWKVDRKNVWFYLRLFTEGTYFLLFIIKIFLESLIDYSIITWDFILYSIFGSYLSILFLIQLFIYYGLYYWIKYISQPKKNVMVGTRRSRMEQYFYYIRIFTVINLFIYCYLQVLYSFELLFNPIMFLLVNEFFSLVIFVNFLIYIALKPFFSISLHLINSRDFDSIFTLSSITKVFHKSFVVVRLKSVISGEMPPINFNIFNFFNSVSFEIKFEGDRYEILYWFYVQGFSKDELSSKLQAAIEQFTETFPSTAEIEVLPQYEVENLVHGYRDLKIIKSRKKISLNFLNTVSDENKTVSLIRSASSLIQKTGGSIIFNFKCVNLPKYILKRIEYEYYQRLGRGRDVGSGEKERPVWRRSDIKELEANYKFSEESNQVIKSLLLGAGMFKTDIYALVETTDLSDFEVRQVTNEIKLIMKCLYNIKGKKLNLLDQLLINETRARYRLSLFNKVFLLSAEQMKYIFQIPQETNPDLIVRKRYDLGFPQRCYTASIILGLIRYRNQKMYWRYPVQDLTRSWNIIGQVGMGKTTLLLSVLRGLKQYEIKYLVLDIKGDYLHTFEQGDLFLVPGKNFKLNLFDAGTENIELIEAHASHIFAMFSEKISENSEYSPQSLSLLRKAILKTCKDLDKRSLESFWKTLRSLSKRYPRNQFEAVEVRISEIISGVMKNIFTDSKIQIQDFYEMLEHNIIMDMNYLNSHGASHFQKYLFVNIILKLIFNKSMENMELSDIPLWLVVVIDDGSYLVPENDAKQKTYIEEVMQMCRSRGVSVIFSNQYREDMPRGVLSIPATNIYFRHVDDRKRSFQTLGIVEEDEVDIIARLQKYHFLVRNSQSNKPFVVETIPESRKRKYSREEMMKLTEDKLRTLFPRSFSAGNEEKSLNEIHEIRNQNIKSLNDTKHTIKMPWKPLKQIETKITDEQINKNGKIVDKTYSIIEINEVAEKRGINDLYNSVIENEELVSELKSELKGNLFFTNSDLKDFLIRIKDFYSKNDIKSEAIDEIVRTGSRLRSFLRKLAEDIDTIILDKIHIRKRKHNVILLGKYKKIFRNIFKNLFDKHISNSNGERPADLITICKSKIISALKN
ncbi:MAG: DUF87 domain-containing protein, partial [Candidatus Lokiarchaeota archaeon]|nr:DUF87 domain-containing protein [Candidatus Lokiarchaeota archaeon]